MAIREDFDMLKIDWSYIPRFFHATSSPINYCREGCRMFFCDNDTEGSLSQEKLEEMV